MQGAGRRDTRITILRAVMSENAFGEPVPSGAPVTVCATMARVIYGRGEERRRAAMESATVPATFRVLATTQTRAVHEGDTLVTAGPLDGEWDIESVVPFGRNELDITATKKKAQGPWAVPLPGAPGRLDFSDPAMSGLLALLEWDLVFVVDPGVPGQLDFSDPANSGLLMLLEEF